MSPSISTTDVLKSKPTEKDLRRYVCSVAGNRWQSVCTFLGIPNAQVENFHANSPGNVTEAFFKALCFWLAGKPEKERTWNVILEAMKDAELVTQAEDLKSTLIATVSGQCACIYASVGRGIVEFTSCSTFL